MEHIIDNDSDIVFLTETWLTANNNSITAKFKEYQYELYHIPRKGRIKTVGGGVGVIAKNIFEVKPITINQYKTFECSVNKLINHSSSIMLICLYRLDWEPCADFFNEFCFLIESLCSNNCPYIIAGDFNIHTDCSTNSFTVKLQEMLSDYNMKQWISFPTHRLGHTLDLVVTPDSGLPISDIAVKDITLSDHFLIHFNVHTPAKTVFYKDIFVANRKIDHEVFSQELQHALNSVNRSDSFGNVVTDYNSNVLSVVQRHAPIKKKTVKIVENAPWFDEEYRRIRTDRRRAERKFFQSKLECDKSDFVNLRKKCTLLALKKKKEYFTQRINDAASNKPKELFNVVRNLMGTAKKQIFPSTLNDTDLANQFSDYFTTKIQKIRSSFCSLDAHSIDVTYKLETFDQLNNFEPTDANEINSIIKSYKVKCSPSDPIGSFLLGNIQIFIPIWVEMVNLSLRTGSMDCLKSSVVVPLLKELDALTEIDDLKNYRPVSNVAFLSKLIERCVSSRLEHHMKNNNLDCPQQFGYKKGHSTELLLLHLMDNVMESFDCNKATVLLLLDLSAAFDTVDQNKLLTILKHNFGVTGVALMWFESFLKGRSQKVIINNTYSEDTDLEYGVPEGSVLGPILFNIYISVGYPIVQSCGFDFDGFADDHQLFKNFAPIFQSYVLNQSITQCLDSVNKWMTTYFLKLNQTKTKILVIGPPSVLETVKIRGIFIEGTCIRFVSNAKNLGFWIDEHMNFSVHVNKVISSSFYTLKEISKIKPFIPPEQLHAVIVSLILTRIDYCNSLFYNCDSTIVDRLQSVQNAAIRLIFGKRKFDRQHLTPLYREMHWLKIRERICFKLCLIVHNCIWGISPIRIRNMMEIVNPRTFELRQKRKTGKYSERAISRAGPKLWNCLPQDLRVITDTDVFKKRLKSFLLTTDLPNFYLRLNSE